MSYLRAVMAAKEYSPRCLRLTDHVISMNPAIKVESRLAALNAILNFTKRKPAQKSEVTVRRAEDFLDEISKDIS